MVQTFESVHNLYEHTPYFPFLEELFFAFVVKNFLVKVPIIKKFHNNAAIIRRLPETLGFEENLLVPDDVIILDGS